MTATLTVEALPTDELDQFTTVVETCTRCDVTFRGIAAAVHFDDGECRPPRRMSLTQAPDGSWSFPSREAFNQDQHLLATFGTRGSGAQRTTRPAKAPDIAPSPQPLHFEDTLAGTIRSLFRWSDKALTNDWRSTFEPLPPTGQADAQETRRLVLAYVRLRRAAPGWKPYGDTNNHRGIPKAKLAKLLAEAEQADRGPHLCEQCGSDLAGRRAHARFCNAKCRTAAMRQRSMPQDPSSGQKASHDPHETAVSAGSKTGGYHQSTNGPDRAKASHRDRPETLTEAEVFDSRVEALIQDGIDRADAIRMAYQEQH